MSGEQERRDRRRFEPPPWEQDAFERFQQEREELEKDAALEAALAGLKAPTGEAGEQGPPPAEVPESASVASPEEKDREYAIPEGQLAELMAGLREEEPRARLEYKGVANAVTVALGVGGIGFVVWSGILLGKAGPDAGALQMMASLLVMVWGFMMIGFAVMLWRKYNL